MSTRQVQLTSHGQVDLDGTHRAIIETEDPVFSDILNNSSDSSVFLKLSNEDSVCCCILSEVKHSAKDVIWLDRFKQQTLASRDGDILVVEVVQLSPAKSVQLYVDSDFSDNDTVRLIGKPLSKGEKTAVFTFSGEARLIQVADTTPGKIVWISQKTKIVTLTAKQELQDALITYKDIGGLDREVKLIREIVEYPFRFPDVFEHLGISQAKGLILFGPPGTGKTLIVKALANEVGAKFYSINGPEIYSKWYGESERTLRELFDNAAENAPSVILIDELDSLVPKRDSLHGEVEHRVVATFLTLMDGITKRKDVLVVGTTNRIDAIDMALRREGRFGNEIHIGVPNTQGRREILSIHTRQMPLSGDTDLDVIAERTQGFVGADIAALCRETAYNALRGSFSATAFDKGQIIPSEELKVTQANFEAALASISPSAMKEFLIEVPDVPLDEIGGLAEVKQLLLENIVYAITKREVFKKAGLKPARGIMLFGPPGTGKTLLAKAVANQCGVNFISVKGPEIKTMWVGESEKRIRFLFAKAREVAPCVIFFDEFDATAPVRGGSSTAHIDSIVDQLLCEMDGIESTDGVFVIAATNRADLIDPALLRPGRFDYQIEVPLPDSDARETILKTHLSNKPPVENLDIAEFVELSDGFSGAEIAESCRQAVMAAVRAADFEAEKLTFTMEHLKAALDNVSSTKEKIKRKPIGFLEELAS